MKFDLIVAFAGGVAISLQGCGGSSDGTSTLKPGSITTMMTTTTTTMTKNLTPQDGSSVAVAMNSEFNAFKPGDSSTPIGNWIRYSADVTPELGLYCGTGCFVGKADCRIAGSVFNSKQMISMNAHENVVVGSAGGWFGYDSGPLIGYYIDSTLIKTNLGKCSYSWDGSTDHKANNGCGCPQGAVPSCDDKQCAFKNMEPPTYTSVNNPQSAAVQDCWCANLPNNLPKDGVGSMCYYKGPAFDTLHTDNVTTVDETHQMLQQRVSNQDKGDRAKERWNEYVLDGHRVLEQLDKHPAHTVKAIVYSMNRDGKDTDQLSVHAKKTAKEMATVFQKRFNLLQPLPVIFLDQTIDATTGEASPWVFKAEDQAESNFEVI